VIVGYLNFPRKIQLTDYTCGPCSVYCITKHFGCGVSYEEVKDGVRCDEDGTDEYHVIKFLRENGLRVCVRDEMDFDDLISALELEYVALVTLDEDHYGVVYAYDHYNDEFLISDPSVVRWPVRRISSRKFMKRWGEDGLLVRPRA
jgi:ABC-type bacteriocin/lantibiotic exporter with double-glycine peptidase domain